MMIPNYALIAEVMLFSEGFEDSKALSRKMVKLYKLASEQLSQQDHYDFGELRSAAWCCCAALCLMSLPGGDAYKLAAVYDVLAVDLSCSIYCYMCLFGAKTARGLMTTTSFAPMLAGMRALKSVLVMAGGLKRANPELPEDVVLIRAMRDSNLPKFLTHDMELFCNIIADLFPGLNVPNQVG
jgi:hypothetical protein